METLEGLPHKMTAQKTCFIIQPLADKYKERCDDIYKPAIENAGLVPYRVDEHYEGSKKLIINNIEGGKSVVLSSAWRI